MVEAKNTHGFGTREHLDNQIFLYKKETKRKQSKGTQPLIKL